MHGCKKKLLKNLHQMLIQKMYITEPLRAVIKENSTTKIRPVFDGSAKVKGIPSINDCVEKVLNLIDHLPSLINRFRLKRLGVVTNIKKDFLRIQLSELGRPFLRFL